MIRFPQLTPENARIYRISHVDSVPWILDNGFHCASSEKKDPNYVQIGNPELIQARAAWSIWKPPGGRLADYVSFYFTPSSIMLYNISTGMSVPKRANEEIVIIACSLKEIAEAGRPFVFTNQHANSKVGTRQFNTLEGLDQISWDLLQNRDFKTDEENPGKQLRYQAEALIHREVPVPFFKGIACHSNEVSKRVAGLVASRDLQIPVKTMPTWYFPQ
jgi:ssDNA thymidine ADP-ribosyltransferase, DarT